MRDYSSLINPRNKETELTSKKGEEEHKPIRFLDRKRRTTVEEVGRQSSTVHIHHHYQDTGAKVCSV